MRKNSGFSLIELSIVLTIISLLIVPGLKMYQIWLNQSRVATTQERMSAIQQGLFNYMTQYSRLPCPASYIAQPGDKNYAREVIPTCVKKDTTGKTEGTPYAPDGQATFAVTGRAAPKDTPPINSLIIVGAVPVRDLGLPDIMRTDAYGHLFTYAVSAAETRMIDETAGVIDVIDATNNTVLPLAADKVSTGTALYVLIDHGKDGKGAYADNASGGKTNTPTMRCDSAAGLDQLNCGFELRNPPSPYSFRSALFGNNPGESWFDDTISYYTPLNTSGPGHIASNPIASVSAPAAAAPVSAGMTAQQVNDLLQNKQFNDLIQGKVNQLLQSQMQSQQTTQQPQNQEQEQQLQQLKTLMQGLQQPATTQQQDGQ